MKILLLSFLLFIVSVTSFAAGPMCSAIFGEVSQGRIFSPRGLEVYKSKKLGSEIVYDHKAGKNKLTWLVIHGLGDNMAKVEELTALAEADGYGVLRVDLRGHGETLRRHLNSHNGELPESLIYSDNVTLIHELLESLKIKDLVIVGHSYGGGISYGLAAELAKLRGSRKIKVHAVAMAAPYVQRIDKFLRNYFQSPAFLVGQATKAMEKSGMPGDTARSIMGPMFNFVWSMTSHLTYMSNFVSRMLTIDKYQDLAMDPWLETYMKKSYRQYFVHMAGKEEYKMTADEVKGIDIKVDAALKVTKGIRDFDLLDNSVPLPAIDAPLLILGGSKDSLVIPAQLQEFDQRLNGANIGHALKFIEGPEAHHLFVRTMPKEVYAEISGFLKSPPPN